MSKRTINTAAAQEAQPVTGWVAWSTEHDDCEAFNRHQPGSPRFYTPVFAAAGEVFAALSPHVRHLYMAVEIREGLTDNAAWDPDGTEPLNYVWDTEYVYAKSIGAAPRSRALSKPKPTGQIVTVAQWRAAIRMPPLCLVSQPTASSSQPEATCSQPQTLPPPSPPATPTAGEAATSTSETAPARADGTA